MRRRRRLLPIRTEAEDAADAPEVAASARQAAAAEAQMLEEEEAEAASWAQAMSMQKLAEDVGVADGLVMCGLRLGERDNQQRP